MAAWTEKGGEVWEKQGDCIQIKKCKERESLEKKLVSGESEDQVR